MSYFLNHLIRPGDVALMDGEPFGTLHHWTDRGVAVRLAPALRTTVTVHGLTYSVESVDVPETDFEDGLLTVPGKS